MAKNLTNLLKNTAKAAALMGLAYLAGGCIMPDHKHCNHPSTHQSENYSPNSSSHETPKDGAYLSTDGDFRLKF